MLKIVILERLVLGMVDSFLNQKKVAHAWALTDQLNLTKKAQKKPLTRIYTAWQT